MKENQDPIEAERAAPRVYPFTVGDSVGKRRTRRDDEDDLRLGTCNGTSDQEVPLYDEPALIAAEVK